MKYYYQYKIGILDKVFYDQYTGLITKPKKIHPKAGTFLDKVMLLFNEMDIFAAFITNKNLADKNLAYQIQGKAFCDIIEQLKVVYDIYLTTNKADYYALETLYNQWKK